MDNFRLPPRRDDSNQRNNSRAAGRYTYRLVVSFCTFAVATPEIQSQATRQSAQFHAGSPELQDLAWETLVLYRKRAGGIALSCAVRATNRSGRSDLSVDPPE